MGPTRKTFSQTVSGPWNPTVWDYFLCIEYRPLPETSFQTQGRNMALRPWHFCGSQPFSIVLVTTMSSYERFLRKCSCPPRFVHKFCWFTAAPCPHLPLRLFLAGPLYEHLRQGGSETVSGAGWWGERGKRWVERHLGTRHQVNYVLKQYCHSPEHLRSCFQANVISFDSDELLKIPYRFEHS